MNEKTCADCAYCEPTMGNEREGFCWRYPPTLINPCASYSTMGWTFPIVFLCGLCGEFKAKTEGKQ